MIAPEALEKLLENPVVKLLAGFGFLLFTYGVVNATIFNLADLVGLWDDIRFRSVWRIGWISVLAMFVTVGLWILLATTRKYEQSYWLIVAAAFVGWVMVVVPVATYLPDALRTLVALVANGARGVAVLLAFVTLDRAIPRMQAVAVAAPGSVAQPQATATQAAGWYPDPRGQAEWRWWDGADWTENTN